MAGGSGLEPGACRPTLQVTKRAQPFLTPRYLESKLKDQAAALDLLAHSRGLEGLRQLQGPYLDLEVRGLPGLQYFGGLVWGGIIEEFAAGEGWRGWVGAEAGWPAGCQRRGGPPGGRAHAPGSTPFPL